MILLLQLAGVLAAGAVISAFAFRATKAASLPATLTVLALAFSYVAFWGHVWSLGRTFLAEHDSWKLTTPGLAAVAGAPAEPGFQGSFAEWLRARIKPGERFYLVPSATQDVAVYQWFTYRLMPNLAVDTPTKANVLIFYGATPKANGYRRSSFESVETYAPNYSMARVGHAS